MNIPVFHDDQHGTAIIVGAAAFLQRGCSWSGKRFERREDSSPPAPARRAIACLDLLVSLGVKRREHHRSAISTVWCYQGRTAR